jgi:hypothetical protein
VPRRLIPALLVLGLLGCTASAPERTPAREVGDVLAALALRGVTIQNQVAGDAGCPESALHRNAVRLLVSPADDEASYTIYLLGWRRPSFFADAAPAFVACMDEHVRRTGEAVVSVESVPWRAYGPGWSDELRRAVDGALRAAGGGD